MLSCGKWMVQLVVMLKSNTQTQTQTQIQLQGKDNFGRSDDAV